MIWISGPPGLGKSTSAQLLSREHGFVYNEADCFFGFRMTANNKQRSTKINKDKQRFVYYEADCFFGLRNPYIPPDVENPTLATRMQRKLIG